MDLDLQPIYSTGKLLLINLLQCIIDVVVVVIMIIMYPSSELDESYRLQWFNFL